MGKHVVIVGGGLAGLAASIYLARAGRTVTVFEKRRHLGGRAVTHLRHGFRFNLGPHAVYRGGAAWNVYRDLGIPILGKLAKPHAFALRGVSESRLPMGFFSLFFTSLLPLGAKFEVARLLLRLRRIDAKPFANMTIGQWLEANVKGPEAREFLRALIRVATYSDHETQSASYALAQVRIAMRGVVYVDEGWQRIVDSLHSTAVTSGVNFVSSSRIVGVHHENGAVRSVELGGLELDADRMDTQSVALPELKPDDVDGARLPADTVLLAVDPHTASELVAGADFAKSWTASKPVTAACLDVALRSLPEPRNQFVLGIDRPLYFSLHSAFAQLAPKGGALIHVAKYRRDQKATDEEIDGDRARRDGIAADERELEGLLDQFQPGWRDVLVHRRFLPSMTVSNALTMPGVERPAATTPIRGLYIAGDWVGEEGILSDASLASARAAAKAILAT